MWRLILVTFGFLGWGFYELSGGDSYEPRAGSLQAEAYTVFRAPKVSETRIETAARAPIAGEAVVTRASLDLNELPRVNVTLPAIAAPANVRPAIEPAKARAVTAPKPVIASKPAPVPAAAPEPRPDLREISGSRVNMRMGPGTDYDIVTKLRQGDAVEVLQDPGDGWLKLRVLDSDRIGWMADYLVTAATE